MKKETLHDSRFVIRKAISGSGYGLFTIMPIQKKTFILEYTGKKIPTSLANTLATRYLFEIDNEWTIDGSLRSNLARYINHACNPNCEVEIDENSRIVIYAIKNIAKDEELSFDYGDEYYQEFLMPVGCKCGARKHKE